VIVGPSGAGKSTCFEHLKKHHGDKLQFSVSSTTRQPRDGEQNEVHYNFITVEQFNEKLAKKAFLEHAEVHGNFYGTDIEQVINAIANKKIPVLDIDI